MAFAAPSAWLLLAIAIPIIALYILKIRLRRIPISTNLFWKQVYDEKPPRSLWKHLRHLLSLLAQLLLLLLLVFSIADPYFSWQPLQARRLVLVLDTSASMQSADVSPSRFEAARTSAHGALDGIRSRDQVAVISAGSRPEVILGMTGHVPTLRRAIDSIQLTDAVSSLESAIALGKQLISSHPRGQILVFTDGCNQTTNDDSPAVTSTATIVPEVSVNAPTDDTNKRSTATGVAEANKPIDVQYRKFATEAANIGITELQARRSLVDPLGYDILVKVRNASSMPITARLEFELDEIAIDVIPLNLKPEENWTRVIEKTSLEGGQLQASLTEIMHDKSNEANAANVTVNWLATDDVAWAIVPARVVQKVLIVSPGNLFLQKVFEANPLVQVTVRDHLLDQWPADTIIVCHRLVPPKLPSNAMLIIDPESSCDLWDVGNVIENPIVTEQDETSPLMTHIRLDNVLMPKARRLEFKTPIKKLAATVTSEPVYTTIGRPQGDCLVLSINLEQSDLAFRTAFPILVTNALSWFAGLPGELQPSLPAGQMTDLSVTQNVADVTETAAVAAPTSTSESSQADSTATRRTLVSPLGIHSRLLSDRVGPLNKVGIWGVIQSDHVIRSDRTSPAAVAGDGSDGRLLQRLAVNLANAGESDLRPDESPTSPLDASLVSRDWLTRPIWFYLVVLAGLLSVLEWLLYQRRLIT